MLPLNVIRKYYPNLSDKQQKQIQNFIYQLCCGLMQYFYGNDWEKDSGEWDLENKEGWYNNPKMSSNPARVLTYGINFEEMSTISWG